MVNFPRFVGDTTRDRWPWPPFHLLYSPSFMISFLSHSFRLLFFPLFHSVFLFLPPSLAPSSSSTFLLRLLHSSLSFLFLLLFPFPIPSSLSFLLLLRFYLTFSLFIPPFPSFGHSFSFPPSNFSLSYLLLFPFSLLSVFHLFLSLKSVFPTLVLSKFFVREGGINKRN